MNKTHDSKYWVHEKDLSLLFFAHDFIIFIFNTWNKKIFCPRWGSNSQPPHLLDSILSYKYSALTDCATGAMLWINQKWTPTFIWVFNFISSYLMGETNNGMPFITGILNSLIDQELSYNLRKNIFVFLMVIETIFLFRISKCFNIIFVS